MGSGDTDFVAAGWECGCAGVEESAARTAWCLGDAPVHRDLLQQQAHDAVVRLQCDLLELGEQSALIHSSRRLRIVNAEHVVSAIASYEQPNRNTWMGLSNTIRSEIRRR
jgi:hypothetical protein